MKKNQGDNVMIFDNIANAEKYFPAIPLLKKAFDEYKTVENGECGKVDIDGDRVFASVQECTTAPARDCPFENHAKYIDVHLVISGEERIDFCKRFDCDAKTNFDTENDYEFCAEPDDFGTVILRTGDFAVLYPDEVHRTKAAVKEPVALRKAVFKIKA